MHKECLILRKVHGKVCLHTFTHGQRKDVQACCWFIVSSSHFADNCSVYFLRVLHKECPQCLNLNVHKLCMKYACIPSQMCKTQLLHLTILQCQARPPPLPSCGHMMVIFVSLEDSVKNCSFGYNQDDPAQGKTAESWIPRGLTHPHPLTNTGVSEQFQLPALW